MKTRFDHPQGIVTQESRNFVVSVPHAAEIETWISSRSAGTRFPT